MSAVIANCRPFVLALAARALAVLALAGFATAAQAGPNLVQNGSFSSFGGSSTTCNNGTGSNQQQAVPGSPSADLSNWNVQTNSDYTFVLNSTNYGNFSNTFNGNSSSCIGLQPTITASPDGGNFLGSDASYENPGPYTIAQTITGLLPGTTYVVTFYMGAGQQTNHSGPSTDWWIVGLDQTAGVTASDTASQTTPQISLPNGGFSGWVGESMDFIAGAATEVLWFMGQSTAAQGQPPFVLLDGVNMQLPEPPAYGMLMVGLLGLFGVRLIRRRKA